MIPHWAPTASQPAPPFRSDSEEAPTDSAPWLSELDARGAHWRTRTRGICDMSWGQVGVARMRFWLFDGASSGESRLLLTLRAFPELLKDAAVSHWPWPRGWNKNVPVLKWCSLRLRACLPLITGLITRVAYFRGGSQSVCWQSRFISRTPYCGTLGD